MSRRRRAPIARETSDVLRGRGWLWVSALVFAAVLAGLAVGPGREELVSPGPLARPHQQQDLACAACHQGRASAGGCVGCHGAHRSARPAHARLQASGELSCGDCHAVHRAEEGFVFRETGQVSFYGSGFETAVQAPELKFRPSRTTHVPLIRASACGRCHDLLAARDPAAICLSRAVDGAPFALCFDEHGAEAQALRSGEPGRIAAVEAARELLVRAPPSLRQSHVASSLVPVFGGILVAVLAFALRARSLAELAAKLAPRARATPVSSRLPETLRRLPVIDASTCLGCSACVDVCPYDVFEIKNYVAVVARPDDCCGLVSCQERCPNGSLVVQSGPPLSDRPPLGEGFEVLSNPGLYFAGDVTGLPLIRIAIEQGTQAARAIAKQLRGQGPRAGLDADLIVIGAGPAGLAAALEAQKLGLIVVVLEQGKVAESIQSFPRGKLILDEPVAVAQRLPLWLGECSKEELVARWTRSVRHARLDLREGLRVHAIRRSSAAGLEPEFELDAAHGSENLRFRARRVVLAVGRRGTPKKLLLEIPSAMQSRVHYELRDAQSFRGQRLVIVGLGDSAMEAAQALAHQQGTRVTLSYRGPDFRRGKARNIEALRRLALEGKLEIVFESEVEAIADRQLTVSTPRGPRNLGCDALLVMIGSLPSSGLIEQALGQKARA